MYNEQRKLAAMEEMDQPVAISKRVFRYAEPFENKEGVDLCELSTEAIDAMIHNNFSKDTLEAALECCEAYVEWCKRRRYHTKRGVYKVEVDIQKQIRATMIASPLHLQRVLNMLLPVGVRPSTNVVYRCYFWMAFMGMTKQEALGTKVQEVDFENTKMIEHNGKSFDIPREAWQDFEIACTATQFEYNHPMYAHSIMKDRQPGELLMRGTRTTSISEGTLNVKQDKLDPTKRSLGYDQISQSGVYYQLLQMERAGYPLNFDDMSILKLTEMYPDGLEDAKFAKANIAMRNRMRRAYIAWRDAFNNW